MDLTAIFKNQLVFDSELMSQPIISGHYSHKKIVLATVVEICEFANEFATFKYWKKNHVIDRAKLLDEYADCIHFFASLANQNGVKGLIEPNKSQTDINDQLYETIASVLSLDQGVNAEKVRKAIALFLGLGEHLGIGQEELESSYKAKGIKNLTRIRGTY